MPALCMHTQLLQSEISGFTEMSTHGITAMSMEQSVNDQTIMTNLKRTRDAVGGKVHLGLHCARTGHRKEAVLIRQRASHLSHYEKIFR